MVNNQSLSEHFNALPEIFTIHLAQEIWKSSYLNAQIIVKEFVFRGLAKKTDRIRKLDGRVKKPNCYQKTTPLIEDTGTKRTTASTLIKSLPNIFTLDDAKKAHPNIGLERNLDNLIKTRKIIEVGENEYEIVDDFERTNGSYDYEEVFSLLPEVFTMADFCKATNLPRKVASKRLTYRINIGQVVFWLNNTYKKATGNKYEDTPFHTKEDIDNWLEKVSGMQIFREINPLDTYNRLPERFTSKDIQETFNTTKSTAAKLVTYLTTFNLSIHVRKKNRDGFELNKKTQKREIKMNTQSNKFAEQKIKQNHGLLEEIKSEFLALTNEEKVGFVTMLVPNIETKEILDWFNIVYPKPKKFASVEVGDSLFHPMLGYIEIVKIIDEWLCFYGNGAEWKSDMNGYIDGKRDKAPVLFFDIDDYVSHMKEKK